MTYTKTISFEGKTAKAFDLAVAALTSLGFRMTSRDRSALDLTGPGMMSTRQSALLGASRIQVIRGARELSIEAELGGVKSMTRFVTLFPIGLSLFLCVLFFVVFSFVFDHRAWVVPVAAVTGANALLWLLLAPLLTRHVHARTCRGLDVLLDNMASAGNDA
jgi:hypothetical protein